MGKLSSQSYPSPYSNHGEHSPFGYGFGYGSVENEPGADFEESECATVNHTKAISSGRFRRNNFLIGELFNDKVVPDVRQTVNQTRVEVLRRQAESLVAHQERSLSELATMEAAFKERKRKMLEASEAFNRQMEILSRPPPDDERSAQAMFERALAQIVSQFAAAEEQQQCKKSSSFSQPEEMEISLKKESDVKVNGSEQKSDPQISKTAPTENSHNKNEVTCSTGQAEAQQLPKTSGKPLDDKSKHSPSSPGAVYPQNQGGTSSGQQPSPVSSHAGGSLPSQLAPPRGQNTCNSINEQGHAHQGSSGSMGAGKGGNQHQQNQQVYHANSSFNNYHQQQPPQAAPLGAQTNIHQHNMPPPLQPGIAHQQQPPHLNRNYIIFLNFFKYILKTSFLDAPTSSAAYQQWPSYSAASSSASSSSIAGTSAHPNYHPQPHHHPQHPHHPHSHHQSQPSPNGNMFSDPKLLPPSEMSYNLRTALVGSNGGNVPSTGSSEHGGPLTSGPAVSAPSSSLSISGSAGAPSSSHGTYPHPHNSCSAAYAGPHHSHAHPNHPHPQAHPQQGHRLPPPHGAYYHANSYPQSQANNSPYPSHQSSSEGRDPSLPNRGPPGQMMHQQQQQQQYFSQRHAAPRGSFFSGPPGPPGSQHYYQHSQHAAFHQAGKAGQLTSSSFNHAGGYSNSPNGPGPYGQPSLSQHSFQGEVPQSPFSAAAAASNSSSSSTSSSSKKRKPKSTNEDGSSSKKSKKAAMTEGEGASNSRGKNKKQNSEEKKARKKSLAAEKFANKKNSKQSAPSTSALVAVLDNADEDEKAVKIAAAEDEAEKSDLTEVDSDNETIMSLVDEEKVTPHDETAKVNDLVDGKDKAVNKSAITSQKKSSTTNSSENPNKPADPPKRKYTKKTSNSSASSVSSVKSSTSASFASATLVNNKSKGASGKRKMEDNDGELIINIKDENNSKNDHEGEGEEEEKEDEENENDDDDDDEDFDDEETDDESPQVNKIGRPRKRANSNAKRTSETGDRKRGGKGGNSKNDKLNQRSLRHRK